MKVGKLNISPHERPKIIAEIGINHGGSLDLAKKMSELAVQSGADFVKTQMHIPSSEMSEDAKNLIPGHCNESIYEIMENCSLSVDEEYKLKEFIEEIGGEYLCTPFSAEAAHILGGQLNVNAFKIGSGECNNDYVLEAVSVYKKPVIVSTGMNSLDSCKKTHQFMTRNLNIRDLVFLHTTNIYPTPYELVRLGGMNELKTITNSEMVGLSDHTVDNYACLGAIALGAVIVERHFTDTHDRQGPDIINSMDPNELKELRRTSEIMYLMRGGSKKQELPEEQDTRNFAFASIVASKSIKPGEVIDKSNTIPKRPGCGDFKVRDWDNLIGKIATKLVLKDEHIRNYHLS